MTKVDAIDWINQLIVTMKEETSGDFPEPEYQDEVYEALEMGIEALEQVSCDDAISRQAVLNKFKEVCFSKEWTQFRIDYGSHGQRDFLINYIEQLSSVTPHYTDAEIQKIQELEQAEIEKAYELGKASQLEIGHWIDTDNYYQRWKCSECGCHTKDAAPPFCPNCGIKMEVK
jgi:rubrerythrin